MPGPHATPPAQPLFIAGDRGQRFALYHRPAGPCRGLLVYLHPFGDEMNKARRMAALQARAFAQAGHAVLQLDLHGCGDSSGEFGEARWPAWKDDVARACAWLRERHQGPLRLWGLRLGALLALDCARDPGLDVAGLLLWAPLPGGAAYLTQFLRIRMASQMLADGADAGGTKALREALRAGETLEIGGYELAPALADAIEALDAAQLAPGPIPVHWFDVVPDAGRPLAPALRRVTAAWEQAGVPVQLRQVAGLPFWATQEIAECPALIEASCAALAGVSQ